jgi:hypothetical protein
MLNRLKFVVLIMMFVLGIPMANAQETPSATAITLERTACHGTCPVYSLTILEDGTVLYDGLEHVAVTGQQTSEIDAETVQTMIAAFENAGYFDWAESYETQTVSDLATVITSVTRDGQTHGIARYVGDTSAPLALSFLELWIDAMTATALWTGVQPDISAVSNGTDTPLVTLERGACYGNCPTYSVALFGDGTVVYTGIANVENIGVHVSAIDAARVQVIAEGAALFGYFTWEDAYTAFVKSDQATVITSVRWEDQSKRITRYDGDPSAPVGLLWVEDSIDQVVIPASE